MSNSLFHYELPAHLIAQHPCSQRDQSRLMVVAKHSGTIRHQHFHDLPDLLQPGDLLILNDSRVLPARLLGQREKTGGQWEGLFLRETSDGLWELLAQTGGKPVSGERFIIDPQFHLILREKREGHWFMKPEPSGSPNDLLNRYGQIPLPPYIRKGKAQQEDRERYQTVYAKTEGSVAAPTAGLHFTSTIFERLKQRGIFWSHVTLHVGLGTFESIRTDDPTKHPMHAEWCELSSDTVQAIEACKQRGHRVLAVGTTATRTLETAAQKGVLQPYRGETDIFIYPPFDFRVIDGLITNFHLPNTTLLLLVGALLGMDQLEKAYQLAIQEEYRFFSYGDAMLILPE